MTCDEARELFSALVDEALTPPERASLESHLSGCDECQSELDRFRHTVALVRGLGPERAPAGFVDRVVAAAQPRSRRAGLARRLFVPWTLKLPLEAAALLLIGGLAVLVFQQLPEQRQAARVEQAPPQPPASSTADTSRQPATEPAPQSTAGPAQEYKSEEPAQPETKSADARARDEIAPRSAAPPPQPATPAPREQSPAPQAQAPTPRAESPAAPQAQSPTPLLRDQAATPAPRAESPSRGAVEKRSATTMQDARAIAPADVTGRLFVDDPAAGIVAVTDLARRLGGGVAPSRRDTDQQRVEVTVPRERYAEFARDVARIGRWQPDAESTSLPATVRISVQITR